MWEAIESNRRRSRIIVAGMAALLVLLGALIGGAVAHRGGPVVGIGIALLLWFVLWLVAVFQGDSIMLAVAGAEKIEKADAPQLFNVVEEMVIASGLEKMPDVYIIPDDRPNAFAAGRKAETRAVCVTSGLLRLLNRDELQGVIAHEIGHHKNGDPALMILMGVMLGAIVLIAEVFLRGNIWGGRRRSSRDSGGAEALLAVLAIVLAILAPILAQMMYFACSRKREFLADASAARFTRYPEGLASALEKISVQYQGGMRANKVLAPMYIVNPMQALAAVGLFSTHPPTDDRVRILRSMGGGVGYVDYDAAFRKVTGRAGCIGKRSLAGDTPAQAREASPASPETRDETVTRSREVGNLIGRIDGFTMMQCPCGVGIKVPPGSSWTSIPCPRCGRDNPIPQAQAAERADGPLTFRRQGKGWQSFRCSCGAGINVSPAYEAKTQSCSRCGRTIEIL
ncbi:MAG TPA: M48 family metallopeptidase [Planctomycetota bacterium]|nr:M48 family metallopeptidase [Planctomycetota bacterium]